ncbi:MAG: Alcohol dehydrogenase GroES domain protein [Acidobacteria bacterium]|nr:Alcohol dehydrogenase GroES domain protein [Acidobacteriota bacterium]
MRAIRLIEPKQRVELMEIDMPPVGARDVLVRVKTAGICHSDAHYRSGMTKAGPLPVTLGHEVAGVVEKTGTDVKTFRAGDRVCIHYLVSCGQCYYCSLGSEQFCTSGEMIGKHRDGGWADFIVMPERSVFLLPAAISMEQGAVMMCSSSTSMHALKKARLKAGESAAVFGVGGLGSSAVQLAKAFGASQVFAVDINPKKLALAEQWGAIPIDASGSDPVQQIRRHTGGRGVDVSVEVIGLPATMRQAVRCLAPLGRAAIAGLSDRTFEIASYPELLSPEAEVIGVADHLAQEMPLLLEFACEGKLNLEKAITRSVPLDPDVINGALDELDRFGDQVRVVVIP